MSIKKIGIIAIIVIILGAVLNIGMSIAGGFIKNSQEIELMDEEFTKINITGENTTIEVIPTANSHGKVQFISQKSFSSKVEAYVEGDTLNVEMKKKFFNVMNIGFKASGNKIIVFVPDKEYEGLITRTDNGQIIVKNLQVETVDIESSNGRILLKDIDSNQVHVKTDNGKIDFSNVTGDIKAKTDNGQISMLTDNLDRAISLVSDNGLINIRTASAPKNAIILAEIDNGRINIFGSAKKETVYGEGKYKINLKTDNGIISVIKGN